MLKLGKIIPCLKKVQKIAITSPLAYAFIFLCFIESLKIILINMIAILVMSANGDSRFLKIKVFRNKGCDVLTSVFDISNKILSSDSNYIVDVN